MTYSIGEVARLCNVSIDTLRYYERSGLLAPIRRTSSGIRRFDEDDLDRLKIIECLKKTNMPLKDIKQFLDWCREGDTTLTKRREMFTERRNAVLAQIDDLQQVLQVIDGKCRYYDIAVQAGSEKATKTVSSGKVP